MEEKLKNPVPDRKEKLRIKSEISKCCGDLYNFFSQKKGCVLCITDDTPFSTMLRQTVRASGISRPDLIFCSPCYDQLDGLIQNAVKLELSPIVLIEQFIRAEGNGNHIIRDFKSKWRGIPFFVMTSSDDKNLRNLIKESECKAIITKPIDANALLLLLATAARDPSPIEALLNKAEDFILQDAPQDAIRIAQAIIKARPDNVDNYVIMGDALRKLDRHDKAKAAYGIAMQKDPESIKPLKKMADLAKDTGDRREELSCLLKMDKISPLNAERKTAIAKTALDAGKLDVAAEYLDRAIRNIDKGVKEDARKIAFELALAHSDSPSTAEKYLRKCLELKEGKYTEEDAPILNLLGLSLRRQGRNADAIKEYKQALKLLPDSPELMYNFALALAENYAVAESCKLLLKILQTNPDFVKTSSDIAYEIGHALLIGQHYQAAVPCLKICLSLEPDRKNAAHDLQRAELEAQKSQMK